MVILGGMMRGMEPEATTRTLATAMIRRDMPPTLMTLAARMKKGMAMRANLSRPAKRRWTTVSRGMAEWRTKAPRVERDSTMKMGTDKARRSVKSRNRVATMLASRLQVGALRERVATPGEHQEGGEGAD